MCVLCMFYVDWELEGQKKTLGRDFLEQKLVRVGLQDTNTFFLGLTQLSLCMILLF